MLSTLTTHYLNKGNTRSPFVSTKCMQQFSMQTAGKKIWSADVNPQSTNFLEHHNHVGYNPRITCVYSHTTCKVTPAAPDCLGEHDSHVKHDTYAWHERCCHLTGGQTNNICHAEMCCIDRCPCTRQEDDLSEQHSCALLLGQNS